MYLISLNAVKTSFAGTNKAFIEFEFIEYSTEKEHLKEESEKDKSAVKEQVKELQKIGKTQREIAKELGISPMTVNRYLKP